MTIKTQTLLMVTLLLVAAVLVTAGVMGWSSRGALLAETEAQGQVIAGLLARSASFGAHVMSDVEHAIGEQMVVEATIATHLVAMGEAAGVSAKEINRRLRQIANDTVLDEFWITDEKGHAYLNTNICGILHVRTGEIDYSNGGHNLPYHLHGGGLSPLEDLGGGALGVEANDVYPSARLRLGPEESLFLYTDGLTEATDAAGAVLERAAGSALAADTRDRADTAPQAGSG